MPEAVPSITALTGFWSYVHADDQAEGGRIARLGKDLVAEYQLATAKRIELFLDRDSLKWGDNWRDEIERSLGSIVFFIPVITPRYFKSAECKREFQFFHERLEGAGSRKLLLPILYVAVPDVSTGSDDAEDPLTSVVRVRQWEDWTDLRLSAPDSEPYRRGVAHLAERLLAAEQEIATAPRSQRRSRGGEVDAAKRLGELEADVLNAGRIAGEIYASLEILTAATSTFVQNDEEDTHWLPDFWSKMLATIADSSEQLYGAASRLSRITNRLDSKIRRLLDRAQSIDTPKWISRYCEIVRLMPRSAASLRSTLGQLQVWLAGMEPSETRYRDLRAVMARVRDGEGLLVRAVEALSECQGIAEAGIDCS